MIFHKLCVLLQIGMTCCRRFRRDFVGLETRTPSLEKLQFLRTNVRVKAETANRSSASRFARCLSRGWARASKGPPGSRGRGRAVSVCGPRRLLNGQSPLCAISLAPPTIHQPGANQGPETPTPRHAPASVQRCAYLDLASRPDTGCQAAAPETAARWPPSYVGVCPRTGACGHVYSGWTPNPRGPTTTSTTKHRQLIQRGCSSLPQPSFSISHLLLC
jgi:hypothetical protein